MPDLNSISSRKAPLGALVLICFVLAACNEYVGSPTAGAPQSSKSQHESCSQNELPDPPAPPVDIAPSEILSNRRTRPPVYPVQAMREHAQGQVILKVLVDADGRPEKIVIERTSGNEYLDRPAIAAVKTWEFNPGLKNGSEARGYLLVPIEFHLSP